MATFLSCQSLLASCPCSTSLSLRPIKTLEPKIPAFPSPSYTHLPHIFYACKPILGFSSKYSPVCNANRRRIFKSCFAAENSTPTTNDGREDSPYHVKGANDEEKQPPSSLMALIEAYKEAILDGEEKTVSQIEARIQLVENKRDELNQKVSNLSAEKVSSKEKYLRLQADFENFRKRFEKERLNTQSDAQGEVIEKLLLMVDNFEKARQQIKPATEKEKKIDASYQGIYKQFVEIMRSHKVAVIATVGKPFDPLLHEAIAREESQDFKEGTIIQETRRGFLLRDRLIRPALVKVSLGPGNKKSTVASYKSKDQPATAAGFDER